MRRSSSAADTSRPSLRRHRASSTAWLTAKIITLPIRDGGSGFALPGAFRLSLTDRRRQPNSLNVPLTYDFGKHLRFNINVGAQYIRGDSRDIGQNPPGLFATAGAGVAWNVVKEWSVISEVFALMGPGQSNPRFQSGLRYSPTKDVDWDVIYGRNLTGEGANWVTVALTIRTGDD